jgi:hypothetical protein
MEQLQLVHEALKGNDADSVDLPSFLHRRVMNGIKREQEKGFHLRKLHIRCAAVASLVVMAGLAFTLWGVQSGSKLRISGYDEKEWGRFKTLETGVYQVEELISEGPDVLSKTLSAELQSLEEDLVSAAEKLDYHLGGFFFAAPAADSS